MQPAPTRARSARRRGQPRSPGPFARRSSRSDLRGRPPLSRRPSPASGSAVPTSARAPRSRTSAGSSARRRSRARTRPTECCRKSGPRRTHARRFRSPAPRPSAAAPVRSRSGGRRRASHGPGVPSCRRLTSSNPAAPAGGGESGGEQPRHDVGRCRFGSLDHRPGIGRPADPVPPVPRQVRVVERVEDAVSLRNVQISLLRRNRPQPSAQQSRRNAPNPRQLPHPGPSGHESKRDACVRGSGGGGASCTFSAIPPLAAADVHRKS